MTFFSNPKLLVGGVNLEIIFGISDLENFQEPDWSSVTSVINQVMIFFLVNSEYAFSTAQIQFFEKIHGTKYEHWMDEFRKRMQKLFLCFISSHFHIYHLSLFGKHVKSQRSVKLKMTAVAYNIPYYSETNIC